MNDDTSRKGGLNFEAFIYETLKGIFYSVFLCGYRTDLDAYLKSSVEKGKAQGKEGPRWHEAMVHASQALEEAISTWNRYNEGNVDGSKTSGEKAAQLLAERHVTQSSRCSLMSMMLSLMTSLNHIRPPGMAPDRIHHRIHILLGMM